jgi:SnoaL-like domain
MAAHDWDAVGRCVADDIVRVGPYGDTYRGRADYVAYISGLLPSLPGYSMEVNRIVHAGSTAWAELTETVDINGAPLRTPEVLAFDLDDDGRIGHLSIYIKTSAPR